MPCIASKPITTLLCHSVAKGMILQLLNLINIDETKSGFIKL